ncbi:hypothetical protein ACFQUX_09600 [Pantoea stewartii]
MITYYSTKPRSMAVSARTKKLLITHDDNKTLSVIDLMRQTVVMTAEVGAGYETLSYFQID